MRNRRARVLALALACFVLGGWLSPCVSDAWAGAPAETIDDVHDLIFHGDAPAILIRLHIQIGGRPLKAAWSEAVARFHDHLDRGDAGTIAREEELADFAQVLLGSLAVRSRPAVGPAQELSFACIDADGDGEIGADERREAARRLLRFDRDDDELIRGADLAALQDPNSPTSGAPAPQANDRPPVLLLDRGASRIRMIRQVLGRFDKGGPGGARAGDQRLGRSELRLEAPVFRRFDTNHDGALDGVELLQFLDESEPAAELIVRLGPRPADRPAIEIIRSSPEPPGTPRVRMRKGDPTLLTIELGHLRVDIRTEETAWDAAQARRNIDRLFYDIDLDDDRSISLTEARGQEPFRSLFRVMDRNGDGRVAAEELNTALDLFDALWRGHVVLSVMDRGRSLLANLDSSGDGRLGSRELREAGERLASFDRDGDGRLTAAEVPRRFELSLAPAIPPPGFLGGNLARAVPAAGPLWFRKMDRNRDGDLSPREFLGPRAEFLRLDADGDGLIDAREASVAG